MFYLVSPARSKGNESEKAVRRLGFHIKLVQPRVFEAQPIVLLLRARPLVQKGLMDALQLRRKRRISGYAENRFAPAPVSPGMRPLPVGQAPNVGGSD